MANNTCSISVDGVLSLGIPTHDSASYYACATASNYTRLASCCGSTPHVYSQDPCYSWCDLPASLNSQFDNCDGDDCDAYSYMQECLTQDPNTEIEALYCSATPHVIYGTATTTASTPTSTFDSGDFCADEWPPAQTELATVLDPYPGCAVLENATNYHVLNQCCSPSPVQYSVGQCYVYCALPRGTNFRGEGDLTTDQALGSFKACMIEYASGLDNKTLFGGIYCRANQTQVLLNQSDFGTTKYLTGHARPMARTVDWLLVSLTAFLAMGLSSLV